MRKGTVILGTFWPSLLCYHGAACVEDEPTHFLSVNISGGSDASLFLTALSFPSYFLDLNDSQETDTCLTVQSSAPSPQLLSPITF